MSTEIDPLLLDSLLSQAKEAEEDGAYFELSGDEALALLTELKAYREQHARLSKMIRPIFHGSAPSMKTLVSQTRDALADLAALSAEVLSLPKESTPQQLARWVRKVKDLARKIPGHPTPENGSINDYE